MLCSKCNSQLPDNARFCNVCGTPAAGAPVWEGYPAPESAFCVKCGAALLDGAMFCGSCGEKQNPYASAPYSNAPQHYPYANAPISDRAKSDYNSKGKNVKVYQNYDGMVYCHENP